MRKRQGKPTFLQMVVFPPQISCVEIRSTRSGFKQFLGLASPEMGLWYLCVHPIVKGTYWIEPFSGLVELLFYLLEAIHAPNPFFDSNRINEKYREIKGMITHLYTAAHTTYFASVPTIIPVHLSTTTKQLSNVVMLMHLWRR